MYMGPTILKEVIESAELYPLKGLFNFRDYIDEIDAYYYRALGYELGVSTGWRGLNEIYNVSIFFCRTINYIEVSEHLSGVKNIRNIGHTFYNANQISAECQFPLPNSLNSMFFCPSFSSSKKSVFFQI